METKSLVECMADMADPRSGNGKRHDLVEILVMAICAIFSEVEGFADMELWAQKKESWLRRFLRLEHGIPSHDTFNRVFRILDPKQFETLFRRWTGGVVGAFQDHIAVDGKTLRGSTERGSTPVHMVSAFATRLGLALGQEKVSGKSNEITAIPELLQSMVIKGCLISLDAMGCQKEIARLIRNLGGDYLLAVKGNQPTLQTRLEHALFTTAPVSEAESRHELVQEGHDRVVGQRYRLIPNTGQVDTDLWPDCRWLGRVDSLRVTPAGESEMETRYYIASGELTAEGFAQATRNHWGVENRLHWCLDVIFREDERRLVKDHGPQNFSLLTKMALNLLRQDTSSPKLSLRQRRKSVGWDDDLRMALLGLTAYDVRVQ